MMSSLFLIASRQALAVSDKATASTSPIVLIPEQDLIIVKLILICAVLLLVAVALQGPPSETRRRADTKLDRRSPR